MKHLVIVLAGLLLLPGLLTAKEAVPTGDPVIEKRMWALSSELRCLVCQGQSLGESHSDFAADMRNKIRELMKQGMTDQQVRDYLVQRYGDYILFRPPLKSTTALLWFGPLILFVAGAGVLVFNLVRRRQRVDARPLTEDEHARAQALLNAAQGGAGEHKA